MPLNEVCGDRLKPTEVLHITVHTLVVLKLFEALAAAAYLMLVPLPVPPRLQYPVGRVLDHLLVEVSL